MALFFAVCLFFLRWAYAHVLTGLMAIRSTLQSRIPATITKILDQIDLRIDAGFVNRQTVQGTDITADSFANITTALGTFVALASDLEDNATIALRLNKE